MNKENNIKEPKRLVTIELRYEDRPVNEDVGGYTTRTITIGIYPTTEEAKRWSCVEEKVLSYTSCKTEEDITPYDIALAHGVLYWETEL